jgi:hypothetical protein
MIKGSPSRKFYENYSNNEFQKRNIMPFWLENFTGSGTYGVSGSFSGDRADGV